MELKFCYIFRNNYFPKSHVTNCNINSNGIYQMVLELLKTL